MAISGPDYKCLYADIGSNKRVNDSGIWNFKRNSWAPGKLPMV